jgi:hypothetical protein
VVGESVVDDGNLEEVSPLGEVGGLEVEGDGDDGLDALDGGGLSLESGVGVGALELRGGGGDHGGGGGGGAAAHRSNPRAEAVDVRGGSVGTFV